MSMITWFKVRVRSILIFFIFVINTDEKIVYPIDLDYVKIVDVGTRLYRDSSYEWYEVDPIVQTKNRLI